MHILLDLDQVLTDFIGASCVKFGVPYDKLLSVWEPGHYDIRVPLGKFRPDIAKEPALFWNDLNEDEAFWAHMPELPWADRVIDLVRRMDPDFEVITTASQCPSSWAGKVRWVQRKFGRHFPHKRLDITGHKERRAKPGVVLIDDTQTNCTRFTDCGGTAVLFPAIHNRYHAESANPIPRFEKALFLAREQLSSEKLTSPN